MRTIFISTEDLRVLRNLNTIIEVWVISFIRTVPGGGRGKKINYGYSRLSVLVFSFLNIFGGFLTGRDIKRPEETFYSTPDK